MYFFLTKQGLSLRHAIRNNFNVYNKASDNKHHTMREREINWGISRNRRCRFDCGTFSLVTYRCIDCHTALYQTTAMVSHQIWWITRVRPLPFLHPMPIVIKISYLEGDALISDEVRYFLLDVWEVLSVASPRFRLTLQYVRSHPLHSWDQ